MSNPEQQEGQDGGNPLNPPANAQQGAVQQMAFAASATPMAEFDPSKDVWLLYKERLDNYFLVCAVEDNNRKKAFLINCIGAKPYKLIRDLCTPEAPASKSYDELCAIMDKHYTPPVIAYKERKRFYSAQKSAEESLGDFLARLKHLASACEFQNQIEAIVLDKFVVSLDGRLFDRVCEEDHKTLTLTRALELSSKWEIQKQAKSGDVNAIRSGSFGARGNYSGKQSHQKQQPSGNFRGGSDNSAETRVRCKHCGYKNHASEQCKFRHSTCHSCNKTGHLATVCKQRKVNQVSTQDDDADDSEKIYGIQQAVGSDSNMRIKVKVDNIFQEFLLDSGASISAIPAHIFNSKFCKHSLSHSDIKINAYSGHEIKIVGQFEPQIKFNEKSHKLKLLVLNSTGPSILGRDFMHTFGISFAEINHIDADATLDDLLSKHSAIFETGLGKLKYTKISLRLDSDVEPIFMKPRQVPYAFREQVEQELDRLESLGVITPVETSDWGTPLVPVLKADGGIRICADYKVTLNRFLSDNKHPLPRVEDIFNALQGGCSFTKLDLVSAYNQLELDESSKKLAAWSTHRGVYLVNRLPFGVKPATGIFQGELEKLLLGIPGVVNFVDDIVVTGKDEKEHISNLNKVFSRLSDAGLKLNSEKCVFFQSEIKFLGHKISKDGLTKTNERVAAIVDTPQPKNITEVRAFAGLINYYGRFINNLAQKMCPIYKLLQKDVNFVWDKECNDRFVEIKKDIVKNVVLSHFNPKMKIVLTCDASSYGIGAVLSHILPSGEERPVAFCSRTLTTAEKNYSVIDKEALAIIFACKKFYHYLIGHKFILRTDHKPLIRLFGENSGIPTMAASRIQRWASFLAAFDYSIEYAKGCDNNADAFSRLPLPSVDSDAPEEKNYLNFILDSGHLIDHAAIKKETARDPCLSKVYLAVQSGNFSILKEDEHKPFINRSSELSTEFGVVMWGYRAIIPTKLRQKVLKSIHASHFGIVKCKSIARSFAWWPGIDKELEELIKSCEPCLSVRPDPPKASLIPWEIPGKVWSRIHIDFAGPLKKHYYLIITDAYSKWPEIFRTGEITSQFTINKLREVFARFGLPETIVSDNGTQFTSSNFQKFVQMNKIEHITSAPGHPATNGAAENAVKSFKSGFKSAIADGDISNVDIIIQRYLFDYRTTEHCSTGESPAKIMFGRSLRTRFTLCQPPTVEKNISKALNKQVGHFKGNRELTFEIGELVSIRDLRDPNPKTKKWIPAVVKEILGPRTYVCQEKDGHVLHHRHLNQIHKRTNLPSGSNDTAKSGIGSTTTNITNKLNVKQHPQYEMDVSTNFNSATSVLPTTSSAFPTDFPITHSHSHFHTHSPSTSKAIQNQSIANPNVFSPAPIVNETKNTISKTIVIAPTPKTKTNKNNIQANSPNNVVSPIVNSESLSIAPTETTTNINKNTQLKSTTLSTGSPIPIPISISPGSCNTQNTKGRMSNKTIVNISQNHTAHTETPVGRPKRNIKAPRKLNL